MVAFLDLAAVLQDDDAVGASDSGETVRDHQSRATFQQAGERTLGFELKGRREAALVEWQQVSAA